MSATRNSSLDDFKMHYEEMERTPKLKSRVRRSTKVSVLKKPNRMRRPHHKTMRRKRRG